MAQQLRRVSDADDGFLSDSDRLQSLVISRENTTID
jgi:hypothetical protein